MGLIPHINIYDADQISYTSNPLWQNLMINQGILTWGSNKPDMKTGTRLNITLPFIGAIKKQSRKQFCTMFTDDFMDIHISTDYMKVIWFKILINKWHY